MFHTLIHSPAWPLLLIAVGVLLVLLVWRFVRGLPPRKTTRQALDELAQLAPPQRAAPPGTTGGGGPRPRVPR